jgi:ubiquinone/menaquinone biosynthesis C-methylase UbiE
MIGGFFPATTMPDDDWWQILWPDPAKSLVAMGVRAGMVAIDLCSGSGLFTVGLAQIAARVYAIDIDAALLDRARMRTAAAGSANCSFILADAMTVAAVVPEAVDYVLLANTFHGVPDQAALTGAIASTLKPCGQFGIVNWHRRPREETVVLGQPRGPRTDMRMAPEEVLQVVQAAGLHFLRVIGMPPYHYGATFRKPGA